ncbi:Type III pantothenate kinase [Gammaproteobacteria bacterium]
MILCLDIGNTHICGGIFKNAKLLLRFRHATYSSITSDQLGIFLKNTIRENNFDCEQITAISFCSVVPSIDYSLRAACKKYFQLDPFILQVGVKTEIKIKTQNPAENGADIIAGIIAATHLYPQKNLIILDLGTVTTIAAASKSKEFLGVAFIPGMYTTMNALQTSAANLFPVEIIQPRKAVGRSTIESIQAGLFFGQLGAIKEIITRITAEVFPHESPILIATGGFAHLFENEKVFDHIEPDLVLQGIWLAYNLNNAALGKK